MRSFTLRKTLGTTKKTNNVPIGGGGYLGYNLMTCLWKKNVLREITLFF